MSSVRKKHINLMFKEKNRPFRITTYFCCRKSSLFAKEEKKEILDVRDFIDFQMPKYIVPVNKAKMPAAHVTTSVISLYFIQFFHPVLP